MSEHINMRKKLKAIAETQRFWDTLDRCTLSDADREMLCLIYIKEKPLAFIGDALGFSESAIKKRHKRALLKLSAIL